MAQTNGGIGNVTPNAGLVEMAMAYSRSRMLCAAALRPLELSVLEVENEYGVE